MKVGITGSAGFIGKHLAETLKRRKDIQLFIFDLPCGNLLKPNNSLKNFVRGKDIIIHAAAINRGSDEEIITGGVVATYNLVSVIKKIRGKPKLIFLSSTQAETDTVYGLSKKLTEILLKSFSERYKIPVTVFRITNVFGEGCRPFYNSAVATFCYQAARNKKLTVTNGKRKVSFIYVKDLVKIILNEVFVKRKNHFYFKRVATNNIITVEKLARLIKSFDKIKAPQKLKAKFYKDLYRTYLSYQNNG